MKPGSLYTNKRGDILLYKESYLDDYHKRTKVFVFKIISSASEHIGSEVIELPSSYITYLELLPQTHPAWILYGSK
jgi:hypothetical protein